MNNNIKVAVIGSSGYIAKYIINMLNANDFKVVKVDKVGDFDILIDLENANLFSYSFLTNIDFIIFTAAISGPDKCAVDFELCWKINVNGTAHVIKEALKRDCKVIFFSSDAVFGDDIVVPYDENSITNAKTPYGKMKKAIEDQFKKEEKFKAIRLSYVASANDKFTKYCLSCINENQIADIFHPFYRNAIVISDVINVVKWLINNWHDYKHPFLNIAGNELVSRVRIADELNRFINDKLKYVISQPNEEFFQNRPKIIQMKSLYLYELGIIENKSFTEKIQKEFKEIIL